MTRGIFLFMENILEQYRKQKKLTFAAIGRDCGLTTTAVLRHCKGERKIGGEAALRYHVNLGIPLRELRPELFEQPNMMPDTPL